MTSSVQTSLSRAQLRYAHTRRESRNQGARSTCPWISVSARAPRATGGGQAGKHRRHNMGDWGLEIGGFGCTHWRLAEPHGPQGDRQASTGRVACLDTRVGECTTDW